MKTFEEEFSGNSLRYLGVLEELSVSGTGVNLNLGVIVRPVSILQVGASFTSRTLYNINDTYAATLEADWAGYTYPSTGDQLFTENIQSDLLITDYRLKSPAHWRLGATVFLGKSGFITADYGQVNYGNSRLSSGDFSMDPENNFIENNYGSAGNARLGAEFRYKILRIRGGAGFYGDPRQEDIGVGSARQVYSFGIGIMKRDFYLDAALINTRRGYAYLPYDIGNNEAAEISQSLLTTQLTMGFNF